MPRPYHTHLQRVHPSSSWPHDVLITGKKNPGLLSELTDLRQHRDQLEGRMSSLQTSRRDLVSQLDGIMQVIKVSGIRQGREGSRTCSIHSFSYITI